MITIILSLLLSAQAYAFETCTPENDYLEAALPPAESAAAVAELPQICIETAHLSMPTFGYYGYCPQSSGKPARTMKRACVSEKYVSAIHSALVDVTDCLGWDSRLAFATVMLESGAHMNAVGAATDVGIGQLTKAAIDEVNLNAFDRAFRIAKASGKVSCNKILAGMTKHASSIDERCGFMNVPENPVRNLVYSVLLLKQNRRIIDNLWTRLQIELPPAVDTERVKTLLAMLAYNSGPAGITGVLKSYSTQMGASLTNQHFDFEGPDEGGFVRYVNTNFPSNDPTVRKRVSKYIGYLMASTRRMDKAAGGRQECIHTRFLNPPVRVRNLSAVANRSEARGLISEVSETIARELKTCHDFEFAFLGRGVRAQDLNPRLRAIHHELCRK